MPEMLVATSHLVGEQENKTKCIAYRLASWLLMREVIVARRAMARLPCGIIRQPIEISPAIHYFDFGPGNFGEK